jgi:hypothetical protein
MSLWFWYHGVSVVQVRLVIFFFLFVIHSLVYIFIIICNLLLLLMIKREVLFCKILPLHGICTTLLSTYMSYKIHAL